MTGAVFKENTFTTSTASLTGGGVVTVEHDAFIVSAFGSGLALDTSAWTVKVDGTIRALDSGIIFASNIGGPPVLNAKLTIGDDSTVVGTGSGSSGVTMGRPVDITNSGQIIGDQYGIVAAFFGPTTSKGFSVTNHAGAAIVGDTAIYNGNGAAALTVKNAGGISSTAGMAISWAGGATITNDGWIFGDLTSLNPTGTDVCTIDNKGSIDGDVTLANGSDVFKNSGLLQDGVDLLEGDNKITNSGTFGFLLRAGAGDDTLTNSGAMSFTQVELGDGDNAVTNSGSLSVLILGTGNDTVTNSGGLANVTFGEGDNKLTNSGTVGGALSFGGGNDVLNNTKLIDVNFTMGGGNDVLTNGGTIFHTVDLGAGNDIAKNTKQISTLELGDGDNSVTNSGTISNLEGGSGNDTIKNTGQISVVHLYGGDDSYSGGSGAETIIDDTGNDTYKLGGGNDLVNPLSGFDNYDGGAGIDSLVPIAVGPLLINLDSKAAVLQGITLDPGSLVGSAIDAAIKNFESASGSSQGDRINGNAAANDIRGNGGDDFLAGGLGADHLSGGAGTDTFIYFQIKESGPAKANRDTITDFAGAGAAGGDMIDLSAIDTDAKMAADQGFAWKGNGMAFLTDGTAQLRAVVQGFETWIQGDVNGDGRVDFSIAISGIQTFAEDDFVL